MSIIPVHDGCATLIVMRATRWCGGGHGAVWACIRVKAVQCAMQERAREQAAAGEHTSLVGSPLQLGRDLLCIARAGSGATAAR